MVRWMRSQCPLDTGFEIQTLTVSGRARYFSATEAPHILNHYEWTWKKHWNLNARATFEPATFSAGSFNHCNRPPPYQHVEYISMISTYAWWGYQHDEYISMMSTLALRCIFNRIYPLLYDQIYTLQHGFMKGRSTVTQLLQVLKICHQRRKVDMVYLDFKKVFDKVPCDLPIEKVSHC